jgi:hypothetical protein
LYSQSTLQLVKSEVPSYWKPMNKHLLPN